MERSLGAYHDGFYGRLCTTLFVCGALSVDGRQAGSTYGQDWVALVAPSWLGREAVEATCRLGIHHEFSSLVWHRTLLLPGSGPRCCRPTGTSPRRTSV
jgi:hypothetical protein